MRLEGSSVPVFTSVRTHSLRTPEVVITFLFLSAVICALFPCSQLRVVFQLEAGNPKNQGFGQCQVTAFNHFFLYLSNTSESCELVCVVLNLLVVCLLPLAVACLLSFHYPVQLCVVRVESLTNLFLLILQAEGPGTGVIFWAKQLIWLFYAASFMQQTLRASPLDKALRMCQYSSKCNLTG